MDHDLNRLRRAAAADPADAALAARLDRALLRGGAQAEVMKRYHSAYVRPVGFDELAGPDPLERRCGCGRGVRYQPSAAQALATLARGECAAVAREALPQLLVAMAASGQLSSHTGPRRACLRASELPYVDLLTREVPFEVIDLLPANFATTYRALPVERRGRRVLVALAKQSPTVLEDLGFMLDLEFEQVLADPTTVDALIEAYYPAGFGEDLAEMICTA
ncbi:MAG TPA: hypothetical protein DEA08_02250 [Planctomycetes bacterium]|nr:hypothetical protein [Planctomycetota bacterium]